VHSTLMHSLSGVLRCCGCQFIIIGDSGTGKSCLLRYFLEKKCQRHTE
jgi:GTPase SAR1 family protein